VTAAGGFVSYVCVRTAEGGQAVTVCDDKAGADESSRRAAEWVEANLNTPVDPPAITEGDAILHFSA